MNKRIFAVLAAGAAALPLLAAPLKLTTEPAGDGVLYDTDKDGIMDKAVSTVLDVKEPDAAKTAITGWAWKSNHEAIFEFQLPEKFKGKKVTKATLILTSNGTAHGTTPDIEVFYYLAPQANGAVEPSDATGTSLGILSRAGTKIDSKNPAKLNVTKAVVKAAGTDSEFIGFRLASASKVDDRKAVIWRTSEFGEAYGKNYIPALLINIE